MRAFISYSHKDSDALDRLKVHLAGLVREGRIETWSDRNILAGDEIDDTIKKELEAAYLFLLLVSPDFIASDYCIEQEMQRALERHAEGTAKVVPIIVEPCYWKQTTSLRDLKALPKDGKPISEWANENRAYLDVVEKLRLIIDAKKTDSALPSTPEATPSTAHADVSGYKNQRTFDEIDRNEFRDAAFETMKTHFRREVKAIDSYEGLRGRFVEYGATSFGSTVINKSLQNRTTHITVHRRNGKLATGDIYYSFMEGAPEGTAQGWFSVSSDGYEQILTVTAMFGISPENLTPEQAAEYLWNQFIEKVGISHA